MEAALLSRGFAVPEAAEAAALLAGTGCSADAAAEAVKALRASGPCRWRELFSARYSGRAYYHNTESGATCWEEPPGHALWAGRADAAAFGAPPSAVAAVAAAIRGLQAAAGEAWPVARDTAAQLLRAACNAAPGARERSLRTGNEALRARLLRHAHAEALLMAAGFVPQSQGGDDRLVLMHDDAHQMGPLRVALARLEAATRLEDDTRGGSDGAAAGTAGTTPEEAAMYRYQRVVHRCAVCARCMNDGSERAWTGRHDAPRGEYRYKCETCAASHNAVWLCEGCADAAVAGRPGAHPAGHALTPHPPVSSRLAAAGATGDAAESAANPWGAFGAAVSARSRQRLKERTGM